MTNLTSIKVVPIYIPAMLYCVCPRGAQCSIVDVKDCEYVQRPYWTVRNHIFYSLEDANKYLAHKRRRRRKI